MTIQDLSFATSFGLWFRRSRAFHGMSAFLDDRHEALQHLRQQIDADFSSETILPEDWDFEANIRSYHGIYHSKWPSSGLEL
eukprot:s282_g44.t1